MLSCREMPGLFGMYPRHGFRRGSDSRSVFDTLRVWAFLPRSTPEKDAIALLDGEPFVVTAFRLTPEGWRFGYLYMSLSDPPAVWWESRHGEVVHVVPPVEVQLGAPGQTGDRVKAGLFRIMVFSERAAEWQLRVPKSDVALVRKALVELTNREPSQ